MLLPRFQHVLSRQITKRTGTRPMPSVFIAEGSPHLNIQVLISGPALLRLVDRSSPRIFPPRVFTFGIPATSRLSIVRSIASMRDRYADKRRVLAIFNLCSDVTSFTARAYLCSWFCSCMKRGDAGSMRATFSSWLGPMVDVK